MNNKNNDEWQETRIKNRDKFEVLLREYEKFSNDIYLEVTKILITLNTALLAFSSPLVSAKLLSNNEVLKTIMVVVWFILGASIISGIIELIIEHYYFNKVSRLYGVLVTIYNDAEGTEEGMAKAEHEMNIESQKNFKSQSCPIAFFLQIMFFVISLLLLIYIFSQTI